MALLDGDSDIIDDTPPDPYVEQLQHATAINAITLGGQAFTIARKNIMSYWDNGGTGRLTHSQIDRVRELVRERRTRSLNVISISPVTCEELTSEIDAKRRRLAELITERNEETDRPTRVKLAAAIEQLRIEIAHLTLQARQLDCS